MPSDRYASKVALLAHFDDPVTSGDYYDPYYASVVCLHRFDTNTPTIGPSGAPPWGLSGIATIFTAVGSGISGHKGLFCTPSGYASGSGTASAYGIGANDFCLEFRILPLSPSGGYVYDTRPPSTEGKYPSIYITPGPNSYLGFHYDTSGWATGDSQTSIPVGKWSHIAVTRVAGTLRLFCNGIKVYEGANSTVFVTPTQVPLINAYSINPAASIGMTAYYDDFRLTVGVGRYTASFTPPERTYPGVAQSGDQTFLDSMYEAYVRGRNNWTVTSTGNIVLSSDSVFGGKSAYFDGTRCVFTPADSLDFAFGNSDFCIEFWMKSPVIPDSTNRTIIYYGDTAAGSWRIQQLASNNRVRFEKTDTLEGVQTTSAHDTNWHHYAISREGLGTIRIFRDGQLQASMANATNFAYNSYWLTIGATKNSAGTESAMWTGWLDELRITHGNARYTANFTPPNAPFTLDVSEVSGTVLDENGMPTALPVFAYSMATGRLIGSAVSSAVDGTFSIASDEKCFCVCVHPTKATLIHSHIDPV